MSKNIYLVIFLLFPLFFMSCVSFELTGNKEGDILVVYDSRHYDYSFTLLNIDYNILYDSNQKKYSGVSGYYGWIKVSKTITDNYILELDFDSYNKKYYEYESGKKKFPVKKINEDQLSEIMERGEYEWVFLIPNKYTGDKIEYSNGTKYVSGNSLELEKDKKYVIVVDFIRYDVSL